MKQRLLWVILSLGLFIAFLAADPALAEGPAQEGATNESCLACHSQPDLTYEFPSGQSWSLHVETVIFETSVHGREDLLCTDCHTDIDGYPHPPLESSSIRFYQLEQYQTCRQCHSDVYENTLDSVHARELGAGNWDAAICTDCHGAHNVQEMNRTEIPKTCSNCHSAIYNEYLGSVHGEALTDEQNIDVPTCTSCHGVHTQEDPRTTTFRLNSPDLCAECHADEALMSKYDISTHVFETYVADFHGTTVTLFERQSPDAPPNKAVCYDCHGVHNMKSPEDPQSQVYQENILVTCQKCHPDASEGFSATWLSHYEPSLEKYPLVYFVDLFYKVLIPAVLGFMGVYVVADFGSRFVHRVRKEDDEPPVE